PMHYLGNADIDRDHYFNRKGWVIIRFAEEQIVKTPTACLYYIGKVIDSLLGSSIAQQIFFEEPLIPIKQWTYDDAAEMEREKYRESYLGIEFDQADQLCKEIETEKFLNKPPIESMENFNVTFRDTAIAKIDEEESFIINE